MLINIRRYIWMGIMLAGVSIGMYAQEKKEYYQGSEHENILMVRGGYTRLVDPYLSPIAYIGHEIAISNEWWQRFEKAKMRSSRKTMSEWRHVGQIDLGIGNINSAAKTNYMYTAGAKIGWGAHHQWTIAGEKVTTRILIGPYLEGELGIRNQGANINKPLSFDAAIDAQLMAGMSLSFYGKKTSYRLRYIARTNIVGVQFVPEYWQSYYEVTEGIPAIIRCSHPVNRNVLRHELTMDFQFTKSTWRIGTMHEIENYRTEQMQWAKQNIQVLIGCIWKYKTEGGKRL